MKKYVRIQSFNPFTIETNDENAKLIIKKEK